uniref:Uncharacterized protein n=1 Tax=Anguilla anguilla TaxID=7936 RepID=A0A0E9V6K5_ANGAN
MFCPLSTTTFRQPRSIEKCTLNIIIKYLQRTAP